VRTNDNENENDESGCTDYVVCTYYQPVLQIREKASKYGVRRACVLLGENGTYGVRVYVYLFSVRVVCSTVCALILTLYSKPMF
jgi:hypothetical protein